MSSLASLSVLVPIYNERATIEKLLNQVVAVQTGLTVEVLACDDGSTDGTREILSRLSLPGLKVIFMDENVGRGGVIKHLWSVATGDVIVHQDADLEYDPQDYIPMLAPLLSDRADVVYGSRFKGSIEGMRFLNRMGNLTMTGAARALYGVNVSDLMTCYKMYQSSLIKGIHIAANGFDFEAEFTARLAQRGARFAEVPVSFSGRTFEEGKKIRAFDAVRVMRELIRCKVTSEPRVMPMAEFDKRMVGVILAAGKGARMYPFSERSPKPILPILNRPLLAHQIEVMRDCGITEVHIVVGHLGYQVASAFGDGSSYGVHIHFVEQESTLGLAHAVGALESRIQVPFLLMLGDIYFHLKAPLGPLCEQVLRGEVNANLVSMYEPDPEMVRRNFVIQADAQGRVHKVIEKPRYVDSQLKGCGLYVFDPHIFDAIRRTPRTAMRDEYEITDSIQILINDGYVTHHHPIVERDLNLTKPADLLVINLIELARNGLDKLVDESATLPPGTQIEHSVVGKGVVLAHPIKISNSVIMPGVTVNASTDLDSVVMDGEHTVYCPGVAAHALAQLQGRS